VGLVDVRWRAVLAQKTLCYAGEGHALAAVIDGAHCAASSSVRCRSRPHGIRDCRLPRHKKNVKAGSVRAFAGFVTRGNVASQRGAVLNERLGDH